MPGSSPLTMPTSSAVAKPTDKIAGERMSVGSSPLRAAARTGIASIARPKPSSPPTKEMITASASTKKRIRRSLKPMALSVPSSLMRSRTEMAMVFPVTSSKVKKTTAPMVRIRNSMLPNCLTHPAANWDSVSVLVSKGELANISSMALPTLGASSGLSSLRTYQPTLPLKLCGMRSSKKSH